MLTMYTSEVRLLMRMINFMFNYNFIYYVRKG